MVVPVALKDEVFGGVVGLVMAISMCIVTPFVAPWLLLSLSLVMRLMRLVPMFALEPAAMVVVAVTVVTASSPAIFWRCGGLHVMTVAPEDDTADGDEVAALAASASVSGRYV